MTDHRVEFDFDITFTNGGGVQGQGFRLDIEGTEITDGELADYIVRDLRLLMVLNVNILNKRYITEAHKRNTDLSIAEDADPEHRHRAAT